MTSRKSLHRALLIALIAAAGTFVGSGARADIPPTCADFDGDITCNEADVGKPCQGGGQCYGVSCSTMPIGGSNQGIFKCETCPPVLDGGSGVCGPTMMGTPCGDGGQCGFVPTYCMTVFGPKYACVGASTGRPTGPPVGEDASSTATSTGTTTAGSATSTGTTTAGSATSTGTTTAGSATSTGTTAAGSVSTGSSTAAAPVAPAGGGGCSMGPAKSDNRGLLALFITASGAFFLLADRRRRLREIAKHPTNTRR